MEGNKKRSAALMTALKGVRTPNIHMLPEKKEPKGSSAGISEDSYYVRPLLWISGKDFPDIEKFKGGEKIVLAMECSVKRVNISETVDDKGKANKETAATLEICAISDITGGKK